MRKLTTEEFIVKAKQIHGNVYDYSKTNYINRRTKVCIICKEHGEFWQLPNVHLRGSKCPKCSGCYLHTTEDFIKSAKRKHGDLYDYSKVVYVNSKCKVCIVCPEHGDFWQTPNDHLDGCCCPNCSSNHVQIDTAEFINRAKQVHGNVYDYSKSKYVNARTKLCIICPKHGEFWQIPSNHLQLRQNCPKCTKQYKGQMYLYKRMCELFGEENVLYEFGAKWLGKLKLDICVPKYNFAIEYDGEQHYRPIKWFGGQSGYECIKSRDSRKQQLCSENNIHLLRIRYSATFESIDYFITELNFYKTDDRLQQFIESWSTN